VIVVLDAVHHCVTMRDSSQSQSSTATMAARGVYVDPAARAEIFALLGAPRDGA
jgi:GTP cyclohydrolase I